MKNIFTFFIIFLSLFLANGLAQPVITDQEKIKYLDEYIQKARKDWNVPGLAIAVVRDGKTLFSQGYGIRSLGKTDLVDSQTLFGCMSTTKAMTAVGMGLLVDQEKISWNDRVIQHLPGFKIGDPYISKEMKVRDLFTHNTGLGNADFLWAWTPDLSPDKILERMQHAQPVYSFRGGYTYQNIMYLVAGKIIEKLSGQSWEEFTEQQIFTPLGMDHSYASLERSQKYTNRSLPHYEIADQIKIITETSADPIAPAGAAWSTADDIAKWVNFLLNNAKTGDQLLLKEKTHAELFKPQIIIPPNQFYPTVALTKPHWTTYGLGFFQHDYRGEMVNFHTGSLAGRTAIIGLLKDQNLGVYIFGNLDHAEVRHALMYKVFDLFAFHDPTRDWSKELLELYGDIKHKGEQQREMLVKKRVNDAPASHSLSEYVGIYSDPFLGKIEVKLQDDRLTAIISKKATAVLNHWHFDTFQATWDLEWWGKSLIDFELDAISGEVRQLNIHNSSYVKEK